MTRQHRDAPWIVPVVLGIMAVVFVIAVILIVTVANSAR